jgi:hypothetical protein
VVSSAAGEKETDSKESFHAMIHGRPSGSQANSAVKPSALESVLGSTKLSAQLATSEAM